ncbi:MAG: ABC transporter permease [Bacteroidota bacterium]
MLKNYIKVALRNILKHKTFSFINIFGLALAMSVCLLVILMLSDQLRYDRFNTKKDRIYRIVTYKGGRQPYATSPYPTGAYLKQNYPAIEEAALSCQPLLAMQSRANISPPSKATSRNLRSSGSSTSNW